MPLSERPPAYVLDYDSPVPLYQQLRERLEEWAGRELRAESPLPTENELSEHFGVSRITVRQAISLLLADGVVRRRRSRGPLYFAPVRVHQHLTRLQGFFTDDVLAAGMQGRTRVRSVRQLRDPHAAELLDLGGSDEVFLIDRLHEADDVRTAWQVSYVPVAVCADLDHHDLSQSIFTLLEQISGEPITRATQRITVRRAMGEESALLGIARQDPVIQLERVSFTAGGRAVEYFTCVLPAALYDFVMRLQAEQAARPDEELWPSGGLGA